MTAQPSHGFENRPIHIPLHRQTDEHALTRYYYYYYYYVHIHIYNCTAGSTRLRNKYAYNTKYIVCKIYEVISLTN